jgi:hypothetical protein
LEQIPFIWFWPNGASAATIVAHDVETDAGIAFIPSMIDIGASFDIRSSFQLVPEGRYNVPTTLIDSIRKRPCEVNVHDLDHSGNLFGNRDRFLKKSKRFNKSLAAYGADGFRAGCMYRNIDWCDQLRISYDMSVPNVAHLEPQRGGSCTVFPYFIGNVLELPLTTIQDYSLLNILGSYSIDLWKAQIELILKRNGLLSFIVSRVYNGGARAQCIQKLAQPSYAPPPGEPNLVCPPWRGQSVVARTECYGASGLSQLDRYYGCGG